MSGGGGGGLSKELVQLVVQKRQEQARSIEEDRARLKSELAERWVPLRKVLYEHAACGCTVLEGNLKMSDYNNIEPFEAEVLRALPDELVQMHKDGCLRAHCKSRSWKTLTLSFDITRLVEAAENPCANGNVAAAEPSKTPTEKVHTEVIHAGSKVAPGDWARLIFANEVGAVFSSKVVIPINLDPVDRVFRIDVPLPDNIDAAGLHCIRVRKETSSTTPINLDDSPSAKRMKTEGDGVPPMPEGAFVLEETVPAAEVSGSSPGGDHHHQMDCWRRWSDEDLEKLRTVVPQNETACGYAWSRIILSFPNRTLSAVQQRWDRLQKDEGKLKAAAQQPAAAPEAAPVTKGIVMSELLELIQKHPDMKKDIQAVVDRTDYTEQQKMAAIHRLVRETTTGTTTGTTGAEK